MREDDTAVIHTLICRSWRTRLSKRNHPKVSDVPREAQSGLLRNKVIPKTVAAVLAFLLGNHRLIEAVERGLAIGLGALMPTMMVDLRV